MINLNICFTLAALLISSATANAATVSFPGYTLDTVTKIVTRGSLAERQRYQTDGLFISQALTA